MEPAAASTPTAPPRPRAFAPACLAAAILCSSAAALPAGITDVPRLHVVVVLDKDGKEQYEMVRGTYIPEAVLLRSPYYKPPPKGPPPPPEGYRSSLLRYFFRPSDPEPEPEPEPLPEAPAYAAPAPEPVPLQAAPAAPVPAAARLAKTVGKERGRRILFNLLAGGAMLLASLALLRYYLNRD